MTRDEAREYIRQRGPEIHLQRAKDGKSWICPVCGSGSGKHGSGITSKDGIHFTCWAGCYTSADIIDIIGLEYGLGEEDYNRKLEAAADLLGVTIDTRHSEGQRPAGYQKQAKIERKSQTPGNINKPEEEPDYKDFFLQAHRNIGQTDYHRGLSQATLNRFKLGFVADWVHPKAPKAPPSPRLIIPTSIHSYLARDTRQELTDEQRKYCKSKVGKVRIFNTRALKEAQKPIFVVEGELDALSIIDVGGEAIALGSTSNRRALLAMLETERPAQPLILAMDNDEAGAKANQELVEGLEKLKIQYYQVDIAKPYKDANEALNADREAFTVAVDQAEDIEAQTVEAQREVLRHEAAAYALPDFLQKIQDSTKTAAIPTGFDKLDEILDGGLYPGLIFIGALSSLGKTTICLQMADQIAQTGRDVLIFSLEMDRNELIAKSVSRLTLLKDLEMNNTTEHAKTTRGILTGSKYKYYSQEENELIIAAMTAYSEYADHIYITEGVGDVGIDRIEEKVRNHQKITGQAPVVLIDYLQIIAPSDPRCTDKQNTDSAVTKLKRLSRDYSIPIIGISSFNRDNYNEPVNMTSFKESGAIEYSSDILLGMQYEGMDYQEGEASAARDKRIRGLIKENIENSNNGKAQKLQLKILKNRNGRKGS